ncbi:MAG TPA: hypothetical protein VGY54_09835 [Polyangiaceae bacterium]|nr:hypothetical protein [Polyangiaceae bacterium]
MNRPLGLPILLGLLAVLGPSSAEAQVHWDLGAQLGARQRLPSGREGPAPGPGLMGQLQAHVALLPMIRLGPYLAHDISPAPDAPDRQTTEAGLRVKLTPPLLAAPWRGWAFVGLGYARAYSPSHSAASGSGQIPGAEGTALDGAFGVGVGARVRGPWVFFAELAGRVGLLFAGAMYDRTPCPCLRDPYPGKDLFAASLAVGLSLEQ